MHGPDQRHPRRRDQKILCQARKGVGADPEKARVYVHVDAVVTGGRRRGHEPRGFAVAHGVRGQFAHKAWPAGRAAQTVAHERVRVTRGRGGGFFIAACAVWAGRQRGAARRLRWRRRCRWSPPSARACRCAGMGAVGEWRRRRGRGATSDRQRRHDRRGHGSGESASSHSDRGSGRERLQQGRDHELNLNGLHASRVVTEQAGACLQLEERLADTPVLGIEP